MAGLPALVNGAAYGWVNILFAPFGVPLAGITKITYERKQNKVDNFGAGDKPTSRGYGNYSYTCQVEVYQEEWEKFIAAAPERDPMLIPPFPIPVVFGGSRVTAKKHTLLMCEFLNDPMNSSQGDTSNKLTIDIIVADIQK